MEYSNSNNYNYNYHEESTNSSELEGADDEENKVDLGVGRSYECVFCKRGFNTAQALGGHMNIHRKDRARNKPKQTAPTIMYPSSNLLGQFRHFSPPHQPHFTYATYFPPAASSSNSTLYESTMTTNDRSHRHPSDPVPGDWRMRLSLEFAPSMINVEDDDLHNNRHLQDKELDLELRLGYH